MPFYIPVTDELRAPRIPEATRFANLLNTAERLRTPVHYKVDQMEPQIVNGRGYTRNQSFAGGRNAGLKNNKKALTAALPALVKVLAAKGLHVLARKAVMEAAKYGVSGIHLLEDLPQPVPFDEFEHLTDHEVEEEILDAVARGGIPAVLAVTYPL